MSRRHWRRCVRSPGKTAGSSGQEPRPRAGQCTSHCGSSLYNIATGNRRKNEITKLKQRLQRALKDDKKVGQKKKNSNTCTLHSMYFSFNVDVCNIPLPVWCSMHPSGRRCYPCCTAPALLSGPVWRFRSPGQT